MTFHHQDALRRLHHRWRELHIWFSPAQRANRF
jgi:hypothetical protein